MGVLPLAFQVEMDRRELGISGEAVIDILGLDQGLSPRTALTQVLHRTDDQRDRIPGLCRIDSLEEVAFYRHGGILEYLLRGIAKQGDGTA
jgi:aconitate hydratase